MVTATPNGKPAWSREADIGDYGGDPNKQNSLTEGSRPYAAAIVRELRGMRGSAYTEDTETLVHSENLALARIHSWLYFRLPEKVANSAIPERSDERLEYWCKVLRVPIKPNEPRWKLRRKCQAKWRVVTGPTYTTLRDALEELLGDWFVELHVITGADLDTPPTLTYWPTANPGPTSHDLGGGTWLSERCHIWVETTSPTDSELPRFYELVNVDMFQILDTVLPAWVTFNWATSDGFLLDISRLDFDGMTT